MKKIAIFGGSGKVGQKVIKSLISGGHEVTSFVRTERPSKFGETQQAVNYEMLDQTTFDGDAVIVTIGTTRAKAGSAEAFVKVDYELVKKIGEWAKQQGIEEFHVLSAVGSGPKAKGLYLQTKWKMEQSVTALGFEKLCIYRPSQFKDLDRRPIRINEMASIPLLSVLGTMTTKSLNLRAVDTNVIVEKIKQSIERDDLPSISVFGGNDIYKAASIPFIPYRKKEQSLLVKGILSTLVVAGLIQLLGYGSLVNLGTAAAIVLALSFLWVKSYLTVKKGALSNEEEYVKNKKSSNFLRVLIWVELIMIVAALVLSYIPVAILIFTLLIFDVQFFYNVQDYLNSLK